MIYLTTNIALLIIASAIGRILLLKLEGQKNWSGAEPIVGYSFLIIYFSLYFVIDIKITLLIVLILPFIAFSLNIAGKTNLDVLSKKNIITVMAILLPNFIYLYLFQVYGSNFSVFRGNIWDAFNYNTMAVAYSKYKYTDFDYLINSGNAIGYIAKQNLIQRPSVVLIPAIVLSTLQIDNFNLLYFYKAFLLSLYVCSMFCFCRHLKINVHNSILLSLGFAFSSWIFYIVEIDALSNLAYLPFIPILAAYMFQPHSLVLGERPVFFGLMAASFIIYPEFGSIVVLSLFISMANYIWRNRIISLKKIFVYFLISLLIIYIFRTQTVFFLIRQISGVVDSTADWWGYFGAYLLGPHSPVTNPEFVLSLKTVISSGVGLSDEIAKLFVRYSSNLLPSVFGFFHLLALDWLIVPANIMAAAILIICIKWLFNKNSHDEWIRFSIVALISIVLFFLFKGSYWPAIKGLSWILIFIPVVMVISFARLDNESHKFIGVLVISVIGMFVPYKYHMFNYGIGVHDGFPSILNKATKMDNDWNFDRDKILNCKNIQVETRDPFKRHFYFLQLENSDMNYSSSYPILESYGVGGIVSNLKVIDDVDCVL